eukprot:TRINITY_DN56098_c0_g1_i1.p1 TRINITY_DN56098_c0_g1~~TRINITY_DN56098_c0_g1_i1.p1  ORF type:complete len:1023 (+),score=231.79 TRINITY_DN56098_c0_g1_i1:124-3192(+)
MFQGKKKSKLSSVFPVAKSKQSSIESDSKEELLEPETYKDKCRKIIDDSRFAGVTMVLTIYALFGDDVRLSATPAAADTAFNALTIISIIVFGFETIAASIGKAGYLFGFFFWLDAISTVTLVLDLTWVTTAVNCSGDGTMDDTSRAGKMGARATRTVRIIRLLRLVKLYKQYMVSLEAKKRKAAREEARRKAATEDETNEDELDQLEDEAESPLEPSASALSGRRPSNVSGGDVQKAKKAADDADSETRVGKKLSEMTTRRVIILVLVMLVAMPQFSLEGQGVDDFATSATQGMEMMYHRWRFYCPAASCVQAPLPTAPPSPALAEARWFFEESLLNFIYIHQSEGYNWRLSWLGAVSQNLTAQGRPEDTAEYARPGQERFLGPDAVGVEEWDAYFADPRWPASQRTLLDASVKQHLSQPWVEVCKGFRGVWLSVEDNSGNKEPGTCSPREKLRCTEIAWMRPMALSQAEEATMSFSFGFDKRPEIQFESSLSILQTIFICIAVGLSSVTFSNDANELLLNPIQRMITKMETIKDNPLEAIKLGDLEFRREQLEAVRQREEMAKKSRIVQTIAPLLHLKNKKAKEPMETVILEKTIIKLGGLLACGFGETGSEIVGQNTIKGGSSIELNPSCFGRKVDLIIGMCEIADLMPIAEVLKENLTLFINQIAAVVHGCVDDFHGAPIKNFGQSFLLVWRVTDLATTPERQAKIADMSMMAVVRMVSSIAKLPVMKEYQKHPGLLSRFEEFQVRLGVALHFGWTIEGAIGSEFKIDPAYVAPSVGVASRLQKACTEFRIPIIVSHMMLKLCSPEIVKLCRLIDHVTVRGARQPIRLYTLDLDFSVLKSVGRSLEGLPKNRFKIRQIREQRKLEKWSDDVCIWVQFSTDRDLLAMRSTYSAEFFVRFVTAYRNYEAGQWLVARDLLLTCHYTPRVSCAPPWSDDTSEWPVDGPTRLLLTYMKEHGDYVAPTGWAGHRTLEVPGNPGMTFAATGFLAGREPPTSNFTPPPRPPPVLDVSGTSGTSIGD